MRILSWEVVSALNTSKPLASCLKMLNNLTGPTFPFGNSQKDNLPPNMIVFPRYVLFETLSNGVLDTKAWAQWKAR